jgi:hypothetical protein
MAGVVAPMYVARQRYLVTPAAPARPKGSDPQILLDAIIIKIFFLKDPEHSRHILIRRGENYMRK